MSKKITDALSKLDVGNDTHWTAEGAPRIETLRILAGDGTLTRDDINKAANDFTRDSARVAGTAKAVQAPQSEGTTPSELANPEELIMKLPADKMPGDAHMISEKATVVTADNATVGMPGSDMQVIAPVDAEGKTPVAQKLLVTEAPRSAELYERAPAFVRPTLTLEQSEEDLNALYGERNKLNAAIGAAERDRDFLYAELGHNVPRGDNPKETQIAIHEYLKSQQAGRDERAAAIASSTAPQNTRSPLDAAMSSRPRNRG